MKHAFLIMAHTNFDLLEKLITKLDNKRNYIFLHIDSKTEVSSDRLDRLRNVPKDSFLEVTERFPVKWGGVSQIYVELYLLKEALKTECDYYHFLSGMDFPIKPMAEIHAFFERNAGKEFVEIADSDFVKNNSYRYEVYHPFQEIAQRNKKHPLYYVEKVLVRLQKAIKIDRTRKYSGIEFYGGSNWCSITKDFAGYLTEKEDEIRKIFKCSFCCDEFFVQTVLMNSNFRQNIYINKEGRTSSLRAIDWHRGSPYTFTVEDFNFLVNTDAILCRKVGNATAEEALLVSELLKL